MAIYRISDITRGAACQTAHSETRPGHTGPSACVLLLGSGTVGLGHMSSGQL